MATARDLIKGSLRVLGVIATGETPSAEESNDALSALNDMLDSWSNERLIIYTKTEETFTLTPSQGRYSMGSGGNFNTTRPIKIENAVIEIAGTSPTSEVPVRIVPKEQWVYINVKDTTSNIPTVLYAEGSYPLEYINLYPVPSVANSLTLWTIKPLTTLTNLSTSLSLPQGYLRALKFNLAKELAPEYGVTLTPEAAMIAMESKANIKRNNITERLLGSDPALLQQNQVYNWLTGE